MVNEHRLKAIDALNLIPACDDPAAEMSCASEATAHALLALVDRVGELVEQQKLANVIAATVKTADTADLVDFDDYDNAVAYVRDHIGGLVNPESETA